eukprot:gene7597-9098_t
METFWDGYVGKGQALEGVESVVLASKTTPSLIQFNESFKSFRIGNDCDPSMDHIISNLKALLLNPGSEILACADDRASKHDVWMDGTALLCYDRPSAQQTTENAQKKHNTRNSKSVPVEELVGFLLSYMKDCAEDYLTRRPMKQVNVIDGSQVETKTTFTGASASAIPSNTSAKADEPAVVPRAEITRVVLGVPVNCTERSKQSLKNAAQLAGFTEEELSTVETSSISIPYPTVEPNNANMTIEITREEFELAAKPITDLVEATVYHMVHNWQLQQQHLQQKVGDNETSTVGPAAEEDHDGFVQVNASPAALPPVCKDTLAPLCNALAPATTTSESMDVPVLSKNDHFVSSIDEVVLVGGSSRVPCVRAALRRALGKAGIADFAPDGPKELCTSLNPEEVVAEGLAIRGAVLSGVSTGKLKELLMMDCVNNAIGVMTWEASGSAENAVLSADSTNVDTPGTRIFNSILHKGMSIPAKNTMRFPLADPNQKFVSLDIFEEVEECKRKSEINASIEVGDISNYEMTYTYHVVATADIAVPITHFSANSDNGAVDITFTMTTDGMLQFSVVRVEDPASSDRSDALKTNTSGINMLIVYIVLMFALYLFVKITLTEAEVNMNSDNDIADTVVQSVNAIAGSVRNTVVGDNAASHFDDSVIPSAVQAVNNVVVDALGDMDL